MSTITTVQTRPSTNVPFFAAANDENHEASMLMRAHLYVAQEQGVITAHPSELSPDGLTLTVTLTFPSQEAYETYDSAFPVELREAFIIARAAYNTANGITLNKVVQL